MDERFTIFSGIGTYDEDWEDPGFHRNATLEIEIVLEGRGIFEWTARKMGIEVGHVIVIPPGIPHRFGAISKIRLGVIHLQHMSLSLAAIANKLTQSGQEPKIYALSRLDRDRFAKLLREWIYIQNYPLKEKDKTYAVWAEMLLLYLYEHSQADSQAMTITKAADFLRENLRQQPKVADLAAMTGLSAVGFRRTFEKIYRLSPKQYQQQCRMQEAKWLLSATDKDLNEIAEQIGFNRLHSFSQWFKEAEGISPSRWRKRQLHMND
ncbi:AraC family transcriptional regulator [Cohnella sp. LGH]|uniref:helix-turn-helix domain-containing protein n=1 Tax=Cohnella sp. LGH TaxID=1619153 RepID=UPI001FFE00FD|nr:AraC family transcriptional regulator [Cohnella sp. LGH]